MFVKRIWRRILKVDTAMAVSRLLPAGHCLEHEAGSSGEVLFW